MNIFQVSKSLRLRRFKSELSVRQENKNSKKFKGHDDEIDFFKREPLSHAISQPNVRNGKGLAPRPTGTIKIKKKRFERDRPTETSFIFRHFVFRITNRVDR